MAELRDLLIIVPSRNRPEGLRRLVDAIRCTSAGDPQLLVCLDTDDAPSYAPIEGVWYLIKERQRFVAWTNEAARLFANDFRYFGLIGDDIMPRTDRWDAAVVHTLEELGTGLCYTNDLLQGEALPTVCFMTTDIVKTLGYVQPPALVHLYSDNFWLELGRALDRIRYLPDVVLEHLHWSAGKATSDESYEESHALMEPDRIAFERYMREGFEADVAKMRAYLDGRSSPQVASGIDQLAAEQAARQLVERELAAIRQTRSYRWMEPARRLRALGRR